MPTAKEKTQGGVLGFRVSGKLMERLDDLATLDHRSRSQMARLLVEQAVSQKEQELGITPAK